MNCLRCKYLRVGGLLRDELYCTARRPPVRIFIEDCGVGQCPHVREAKHPRWTPAEDVWLRLNYARRGRAACAAFLGRAPSSAANRARKLGLRPSARHRWMPADDAYLREHYRDGAAAKRQAIAQRVGSTPASVSCRAHRLGLRRKKEANWSPRDIAYLRRRAWREPLADIARHLHRTLLGVHLKMRRMHIRVRQHWDLRDVLRLFRSTNHDLVRAAIQDGRLPAVERSDGSGRHMWQIKANDVARFVIAVATDGRETAARGRLPWLMISPRRLAKLVAEANGATSQLDQLQERLSRVLRIECRAPMPHFRSYVGGKLRRRGCDAYVPQARPWMLTDAPAAAIDEIFTPPIRARMRVTRLNGDEADEPMRTYTFTQK